MLLGEMGEGAEWQEWKLRRGEGGRHMGTQIHSVSLATGTATASSGVAPLSLVAGPVNTTSVSGTSSKAGGLDCSVWAAMSIHQSFIPALFSFLLQHPLFQSRKIRVCSTVGFVGAYLRSPLCHQSHTPETGWWIWRREAGGLTGGWRTASKHLLHTSNLALSLSPLLDKWACPDWRILVSKNVLPGCVQETEDAKSGVCDGWRKQKSRNKVMQESCSCIFWLIKPPLRTVWVWTGSSDFVNFVAPVDGVDFCKLYACDSTVKVAMVTALWVESIQTLSICCWCSGVEKTHTAKMGCYANDCTSRLRQNSGKCCCFLQQLSGAAISR